MGYFAIPFKLYEVEGEIIENFDQPLVPNFS
jgi:hypothetical protein